MKKEELQTELKQLESLGYITEDQLKKIENQYLKIEKNSNNKLLMVFALLGVLFIGSGLISIFAYNWNNFNPFAKAIIALIPLIINQLLLYWSFIKGKSKVWTHSLTLLMGFTFLLALGLIYQAYQLSYSIISMLLVTYILMLPIIYLLDGYYLSMFCIGGIYFFSFDTNFYLLLILLLIPYYLKKVKVGENCTLLSLCYMICFLSLPAIFSLENAIFITALTLLVVSTLNWHSVYYKLSRMIIYALSFLSAVGVDFIFHENIVLDSKSLIVIFVLLGVFIFRFYKMPKKQELPLLCGLTCIVVIVQLLVVGWLYDLCINVAILSVIIAKMVKSIRENDISYSRKYIALISIYVVIKMLTINMGLVSKGFFFILIGIAFLVSNYYIVKKFGGDKNA